MRRLWRTGVFSAGAIAVASQCAIAGSACAAPRAAPPGPGRADVEPSTDDDALDAELTQLIGHAENDRPDHIEDRVDWREMKRVDRLQRPTPPAVTCDRPHKLDPRARRRVVTRWVSWSSEAGLYSTRATRFRSALGDATRRWFASCRTPSPTFRGTVTMRAIVQPTGRVVWSDADPAPPAVEACLRQLAQCVVFPQRAHGEGPLTLTWTLEFR